MPRGDKQKEVAARNLALDPDFYRKKGALGKGKKHRTPLVKPGSMTPAERGRIGAQKRWGIASSVAKAYNNDKERQVD